MRTPGTSQETRPEAHWADGVCVPPQTQKKGGSRGLRFQGKKAIHRWPRKSRTHRAGKFWPGSPGTVGLRWGFLPKAEVSTSMFPSGTGLSA